MILILDLQETYAEILPAIPIKWDVSGTIIIFVVYISLFAGRFMFVGQNTNRIFLGWQFSFDISKKGKYLSLAYLFHLKNWEMTSEGYYFTCVAIGKYM